VILTYIALAAYARRHDWWSVSQARLALDRGKARSTIRRHISSLRSAGLIETEVTTRQGGYGGSLKYRCLAASELGAMQSTTVSAPPDRISVSEPPDRICVSAPPDRICVSHIDIPSRQKQKQKTTTTTAQPEIESETPTEAATADGGGGRISSSQGQDNRGSRQNSGGKRHRRRRSSTTNYPITRQALSDLGILTQAHDDILSPYTELDDYALRLAMSSIVVGKNHYHGGDPREIEDDPMGYPLLDDIAQADKPIAVAIYRLRGSTCAIMVQYHDIMERYDAWIRAGCHPTFEEFEAQQMRAIDERIEREALERQRELEAAAERERSERELKIIEHERKRKAWQDQLDADERARQARLQAAAKQAADHERQKKRAAQEQRLLEAWNGLADGARAEIERQRVKIVETKHPRSLHDHAGLQAMVDRERASKINRELNAQGLECRHRRELLIAYLRLPFDHELAASA
jgi:hypothetical protein